MNSDSPADPLLTSFPDDTQGGPTAPLAGPQGRFGRVIHAIDPRQLIGVLALAAGVGCGIAESFLHKPGPWLEIIALAATLGGVWLLAQGWRMPAFFLPTSLVCLLIGGLGFGLRFDAMSWPGLGAGAALAMCWGQRRHKSIQWLVGSALAACYVVAAVAGLVECSRGGGLLWITAQGIGSMLLGFWLSRFASRAPEPDPEQVIAARALMVVGIVLPYAALFVLLVRPIAT